MSDCSGQTSQFEPITGRWKAEPDFNLDPPVRMPGGSVQQWLGALLLIRSHAMDRVPSSISACPGRRAGHRPALRCRRCFKQRSRQPRPIADASLRLDPANAGGRWSVPARGSHRAKACWAPLISGMVVLVWGGIWGGGVRKKK